MSLSLDTMAEWAAENALLWVRRGIGCYYQGRLLRADKGPDGRMTALLGGPCGSIDAPWDNMGKLKGKYRFNSLPGGMMLVTGVDMVGLVHKDAPPREKAPELCPTVSAMLSQWVDRSPHLKVWVEAEVRGVYYEGLLAGVEAVANGAYNVRLSGECGMVDFPVEDGGKVQSTYRRYLIPGQDMILAKIEVIMLAEPFTHSK